MMINKPKLIIFIIATILILINGYMYGIVDNWMGILYLSLAYVSLILVALYDIGKDEV